MNTATIIDTQIANEIVGHVNILVFYMHGELEYCTLINQGENQKFIKPICMNPRKITEQQYTEILGMIEDNRFYNTDSINLKTKMNYDDFWNRYYNRADDLKEQKRNKKQLSRIWDRLAKQLLRS